MNRHARVPAQLSASLHKRLNAYALAASAAGVGFLALAQPAEARIIHKTLDAYPRYLFNPAEQSVPPFVFWVGATYITGSISLEAVGFMPYRSAVSASAALGKNNDPACLRKGAPIGPGRTWGVGGGAFSRGLLFTYSRFRGGTRHHKGNFKFNRTDYLGFRFSISGNEHYGWVRIRVPANGKEKPDAHLIDYAYETIPNKSIIAGETHGKDDATLGRLAQGASGLSAWR